MSLQWEALCCGCLWEGIRSCLWLWVRCAPRCLHVEKRWRKVQAGGGWEAHTGAQVSGAMAHTRCGRRERKRKRQILFRKSLLH